MTLLHKEVRELTIYNKDMTNFFKASQKWKVYEDEEFRLLDKLYVHNSLLDFDVRYRAAGGKVRVQQGFQRSAHDHVSSNGQVNIELPLGRTDKSLYSSFNSSGKILLAYDNGLIELTSGSNINFFSSFQTTRAFKEQVYKFGFACTGSNYNYGLRFRYSPN
jgi:hypothetical protein